jgi:hypothetical protein
MINMYSNHETKNIGSGYRPGPVGLAIEDKVKQVVRKETIHRLRMSEDMRHFMDYLRNKHPSISNRQDYLLSERKYGSIYGEMMAGKSAAFIATHHYYQMCGVSSIMCVEQSMAITQFEKSIEDYTKVYEKYYARKGWTPKPIEYELANTLGLDTSTNEVIDHENIADVFRTTGNPKMIVAIAHQDQCYRLIKLIYSLWGEDPAIFRHYVVVFDESHLTMFPNEAECRLDHLNVPEDTCSGEWPVKMTKYESITHLIFFARQIIAGTATPQQNWFSKFHPIEFIIDVNPGVGYRDVLSLDYTIIPELRDTPVAKDPALHKALDELAAMEPYDKTIYRMSRDHPISVLVNVSYFTKDHKEILDYIIENHDDKFVVITLNVEGTHMHFPEHIADYLRNTYDDGFIKLNYGSKKPDCVKSRVKENNRVFYKNVPIAATYQFLADLPEKLVERIVLISGNMVKQGCRISSYDFSIRLTHEFLRDTTSLGDNLLQKLRLVGYIFDNRPSLVVWCTGSVQDNTVKGIKIIRDGLETLKRDLNDINTTRHKNTYNILKDLEISSAKLGTKPMCKNKMPMTETSDSDDDFALNVGDYKIDLYRTVRGNMNVKMPKGTCIKRNCKNKTRNYLGLCGKCCNKKSMVSIVPDSVEAWNKLLDCYNRKGKLYNIVNLFVNEELRSLSSDDLAKVCNGKFQYDNYNHWDLGRSAKYHIITKTCSGPAARWNIRPDALEALKIDY